MAETASPGFAAAGAPQVSVVIPTRNRQHLIADAVGYALDQPGVTVEVVVVDDASDDGTGDVLAEIDDQRLRVVRRRERGRLAAARNSGIGAASGRWVAFLDDDDLWSPDKLRLQLAAVEGSGAGFAYGGAVTVDDDLEPLHLWRQPEPKELLRELLALNVLPAGASNVLVRTALVRELGGFDPALSHTADWDMWIRLARATKAASVPEVVVAYRLHESQESRREQEMVAELDVLEAKFRALRAELGVELDRAAFEEYAAKRSNDPEAAATRPAGRVRRALTGIRARAGGSVGRPWRKGGRTAVASPDWLTARTGGRRR